MIHRRLLVSGRVQNVFYRDWTVTTARGLGLDGWVRNRADGRVEIRVLGPSEMIDRFVTLCHDGPPAARVDAVAVEEASAEPLDGFIKRATM